MIDAEERKWEQGIGLDTQLPLTVNDEWKTQQVTMLTR